MGWQPRPSPRPVDASAAELTGRGIAYVHYKHEETLVALGMEVAVERSRATSCGRSPAATLGNAVFDTTGVRLRTVPFRAERVTAALAGR
jgi:hypothetical protein